MTKPSNKETNASNGAVSATGGDLTDFFTIGEVADLYGVTRPAVKSWIDRELLPAYKVDADTTSKLRI